MKRGLWKRLCAMILALCLLTVSAAAATQPLIMAAPEEDPWGLTMTLENVSSTGATVVFTQSGGEPSGELETGAYYWLEKYEDGRWAPLEVIPDNLGWIAIAYVLPMNERREFSEGWDFIYGELPAGSYRLCKPVMDFRGSGDYDEKIYRAEFTIAPEETKAESVTRAEFVTLLWRLEGEPVVNYLMLFGDVDQDSDYGEAVRWAAAEKIVNGYEDGTFRPDAPVTRQQLAAMLWRYARHEEIDVSVGEDTNILSFEDAFEIAEYAIPAMQWACGAGLLQTPDAYLRPSGEAGAAFAASVIERFLALN